MFFECILRDKSVGGKIKPVGPSTGRFEPIFKKNIKNSVFHRPWWFLSKMDFKLFSREQTITDRLVETPFLYNRSFFRKIYTIRYFWYFSWKRVQTGRLMVQPVWFYHQSIYLAKWIRKTYSLLGFGVPRPMNRDEPRLTATVTGWFMLAIVVFWMEITMQKEFYENSFNFR